MATSQENLNVVRYFTFEEARLLLQSSDEKVLAHRYGDDGGFGSWDSRKIIWKKDGVVIAHLSRDSYYDDRTGEQSDDPVHITIFGTTTQKETRFKNIRNVFELEFCREITSKTSTLVKN